MKICYLGNSLKIGVAKLKKQNTSSITYQLIMLQNIFIYN